MDYSKFDSTIPPFAIDSFFLIMEENLKLSPVERKAFHLLRFYVKYTPTVWKGKLYFLSRGIASGLLITNVFDSWWNLTLWHMSNKIKCLDKGNKTIKELVLSFLSDKQFRYVPSSSRVDIAVCGDDVLIYTSKYEILIHEQICLYYDMKCSVNIVCADKISDTFFLGRYWDKFSRPIQSFLYISTHLLIRERWYKKGDVPFDISEDLDINRFLSICCPLANGVEYIKKYFRKWPKLLKFLNKRDGGFTLLKDDWVGGKYKRISGMDIFDWTCY
jgi:hypothetical protein